MLFSDIRGFTAIAESMRPDAIAQLLSEYFTEMVEVIFEHGGTLDKFIGDAIMALWGAPIAHADDPDRALRAALAMQRLDRRAQRALGRSQGRPEIGVGIGHQLRRGVRRQHRQPPPAGVHGDRRRGERRRPALRRGGPGRDPGERGAAAASCGTGDAASYLPEMALKGKAQVVQVYRVRGLRASAHLGDRGGAAPPVETVGCPARSSSSSTSRSGSPITLKKSPSIRSTSAAPYPWMP